VTKTPDIKTFDIRDILKFLPHRYPFLLVDRVTGGEVGKSVIAVKNVTVNEPFFTGHFPEVPTMPGVLIIEALAQTCGLLACQMSNIRADSGHILYLAGVDHARFRRPVVPGDQLVLHSELEKQKRDIWKFRTRATVNDVLVCEADMLCVLRDARRLEQE
jgi:3-hydroxyacyl-[acyl-carrier-protein] dehydratase